MTVVINIAVALMIMNMLSPQGFTHVAAMPESCQHGMGAFHHQAQKLFAGSARSAQVS